MGSLCLAAELVTRRLLLFGHSIVLMRHTAATSTICRYTAADVLNHPWITSPEGQVARALFFCLPRLSSGWW
jgi:hypothetical protein